MSLRNEVSVRVVGGILDQSVLLLLVGVSNPHFLGLEQEFQVVDVLVPFFKQEVKDKGTLLAVGPRSALDVVHPVVEVVLQLSKVEVQKAVHLIQVRLSDFEPVEKHGLNGESRAPEGKCVSEQLEPVSLLQDSERRVVSVDVDCLENVDCLLGQVSRMRILQTSLVHQVGQLLGDFVADFIVEESLNSFRLLHRRFHHV